MLSLSGAERDALLGTFSPSLREAVEGLLGAHDTSGDFLDTSPINSGAAIRSLAESMRRDPLLGEAIGPWRVRARLGEGSMGTVYRADRDDGLFERTVALKVIRAGLATGPASGELRQRFDAERRLLANLDHPGIAGLLDGGTLPDGRPWLAMELVEGETITVWAERQRLDVPGRVGLFLGVLDALAHAHRHLVVHCDLKPPHVLVETGRAGRPQVRVLDFGVAAALGDGATAGPHTTAYAPPEQIASGAITTSADVFALGVMLFELLAGRRPERSASGAVSESLSSAAAPEARRRLKGDLDAILDRALHDVPEARYPTAEAFAADLRRHLRHEPVQARPSTAWYLLSRFVRRRRLAVAASGVVLAALVGLGAYHTASVTRERDAARREAAKATATASFLTDLFRTYDPDAEIGDRVSARDLLDSRVARLREMTTDPATPGLLEAAARAYAGLALYDEALPLAQEALALRRADAATRPAERLASLLLLSDLQLWTEQYGGADSLTSEAIALARGQRDPAILAEALRMRANYVAVTEGHARADSLLQEALAIQRRTLPADAPELAATLHVYGMTLVHSFQRAQAVAPLREALRIRRARLGPSHPDLAQTLTMLGVALSTSGSDRREAVRMLVEADRIFDEALDRAHPEAATAIMNLGHAAWKDGQHESAEAYYLQGLALRRSLLGPQHHTVAFSLNHIGYARAYAGDLGEAYARYDEARRILERSFPEGHIRTSHQLVAMGKIRRRQGRYTESAALLRDAVTLRERVAVHRPKLIAKARLHLAATLLPLGRRQEAERLLDAAATRLTDPTDPDWPTLNTTYAQLYAETGRPRLAARHEALAQQ
ncbi:serine/threonine-protein kinase [Rubricoccus marinus]|uniref:serine/threonine-protein kinase n=1 Tax=Rubricoccus marinus TaxID=716817 RepID=UPI0015C5E6C9|nr:serine/threonine-protein kinase [Rubricoccus marinus]